MWISTTSLWISTRIKTSFFLVFLTYPQYTSHRPIEDKKLKLKKDCRTRNIFKKHFEYFIKTTPIGIRETRARSKEFSIFCFLPASQRCLPTPWFIQHRPSFVLDEAPSYGIYRLTVRSQNFLALLPPFFSRFVLYLIHSIQLKLWSSQS